MNYQKIKTYNITKTLQANVLCVSLRMNNKCYEQHILRQFTYSSRQEFLQFVNLKGK